MINPKREFKKVEKLIYDLAWKFTKKTGLAFEDVRSEACMAFMKACESYVSGSSKFSSWCYTKVTFHLIHWHRDMCKDRLVFVEEIKDEMLEPDTTALRNTLRDQLSDLSPEAKRLIDIILHKAGMEPQNPRTLLEEACTSFRYEHGVDSLYTDIVVHEIRSELSASI